MTLILKSGFCMSTRFRLVVHSELIFYEQNTYLLRIHFIRKFFSILIEK